MELHNQTDEHLYTSEGCEHGYYPTVPEYMDALGPYWTAITACGSLITVALIVFFIEHILYTYKNCHSVYRRHINWIASFYPLAALLSLLALVVPRAYSLCAAVKLVFFSLGISHFTDLTVQMFGCEKAMLAKLGDSRFTLSIGIFRCCPWIPQPHISKVRVRFVKWLLWQLPYTQTLYYFFDIYWTTAESDKLGRIVLSYAYIVMDIINALSFLTAIYAFSVFSHLVQEHLTQFNYKRKASTLLLLLIVLKVPGLILTVLGNYNYFPCRPPYINSMIYAHTVVNISHLVLVCLFGGLEYWQYHTLEFLHPTSDKHHTHSHELIIHGQACVCIISEMNTTSKEMRRGSAILRRGSANLAPIILENKMVMDPKFDLTEDAEEEKRATIAALPAPSSSPSPKNNGVSDEDIEKTRI